MKEEVTTKDTKDTKGLVGMKEDLIFADEAYAIQGAVFEVYREMGCGFLEAVYQECLEREFAARGIPFTAQQELKIAYKGQPLKQVYKPDFVCYGKIIVELKAAHALLPEHQAQTFNYLTATQMRLALLVNFGHFPGVEIKRIVV